MQKPIPPQVRREPVVKNPDENILEGLLETMQVEGANPIAQMPYKRDPKAPQKPTDIPLKQTGPTKNQQDMPPIASPAKQEESKTQPVEYKEMWKCPRCA